METIVQKIVDGLIKLHRQTTQEQIKKIEYNGEIHTIAEWSRIVEIPYYTIEQRILKLNWNIGEALGYEKHKRKGVQRNERGQFIST